MSTGWSKNLVNINFLLITLLRISTGAFYTIFQTQALQFNFKI